VPRRSCSSGNRMMPHSTEEGQSGPPTRMATCVWGEGGGGGGGVGGGGVSACKSESSGANAKKN
jgi:hypothetical protein